ncbi:hypothetical protein AB9K24_00965 [Meridianimaribacter flavus]
MRKVIFYLIFAFTTSLLIGCKTDNVDGIIIGDTLFVHQSFSRNKKMKKLIQQSLNKDSNALVSLKNFPNGGAASSYDLGYVITQIIYRLGEEEFINLVKRFPENEQDFEGLIDVGLEYGDNDYNGKMDNKRFKDEFPKLYNFINH